MAKDHGSSIKKDDTYEELKEQGYSKEKAARIANAQDKGNVDHASTELEERTKEELYEQAQEIGIEGRSDMDKDELIAAIRNH